LVEEDGEHVDVSDACQVEERGDGIGVLARGGGMEDGGESELAGTSEGEVWPLGEGLDGIAWFFGGGV
jgi:hypothetical protein